MSNTLRPWLALGSTVACLLSACGDGGSHEQPTPDARVPDASGDASVPADGTQWVLGYYVGYQIDRYPLADIDWSAMTHIALAPMTVNGNGTVDTRFTGFGTDAQGAAFAQDLSTAAHAHGVKAMLMLGGAGLSDNVKPAMSDLPGFVGRLLDTMDALHFDGIDLDVEASNFDIDDFITLASALRAARPSILLSVPGATVQYGGTVDPKVVTLATYLDRYNIQSYQGGSTGMFTGGDSNGSTFESWFYGAISGASDLRRYAIDDALARLAAAGIPKAKLGMGIAFYSACYRIPDTTPSGGSPVSGPRMPADAPSEWCWDCGVGGGDNVASYNYFYEAGGLLDLSSAAERMRDSVAQEPYLSFATTKYDALCGGNTRFVMYEDEISLRAKGAFSRTNGYGGVIVWTIQQGYLPANAAGGRARNALTQALREGFLAP